MALTLEHMRTLTLEDLETLQRLHGDTLTETERKNLEKALAEKREGSGETEGEQEGESDGEGKEKPPPPAEGEAESGPPTWWKEPASADEVADKLLERFAEAERIADEAAGEGEQSGDNPVGGEGESKGKEQEEKESKEKETAGSTSTTEKDDAPEQEHWFYRGKKKKVKSDA